MNQQRANEFERLPKKQKARLLAFLMALDDEQRRKYEAYRANGSEMARQAYISSRCRLQEAEELHRQAREGEKGTLQRLVAFARPADG